jgi:sugar lactone lactonase YvrE
MTEKPTTVLAALASFTLLSWACLGGDARRSDVLTEMAFPVEPTVVVSGEWGGAEGIAFNGEGDLFVKGNHAIWRVDLDGSVTEIVEFDTPVGLTPIGERDLLVAVFNELVLLNEGPNQDGFVARVTPEGDVDTVATGMGDPNFIVVLPDESLLVSDDFTNEIWLVSSTGEVSLFTDAVDHPNGMVLSLDERELYVAQIFTGVDPVEFDDRVWRLPLEDGKAAGAPEVLFATGGVGANDGLTMDVLGRVYVASNREGHIWRIDPSDGSAVVIAENVQKVKSLAFGEGEWDRTAIYATVGGDVLKFEVGVEGAPLVR